MKAIIDNNTQRFSLLGELLDVQRKKESSIITSFPISAIPAGNYMLSIQASKGHYCTPRQNLSSYTLYSSFEICLMKKDYSGLNPKQSSKIRSFPRYSELIRSYDSHGVFGWVADDLIMDLLNYLKK